MARRTIAGKAVRLYRAAGLGKAGSRPGSRSPKTSPKAIAEMGDKKLARRLCGANCAQCGVCEYGREWLRRQERDESP